MNCRIRIRTTRCVFGVRGWLAIASAVAIAGLPLSSARPAAAQDKEVKLADPEDVTLETKDGVELRSTWYPGGVTQVSETEFRPVDGKKVVPIIMLHGWDGRGSEYAATARYLQQLGHAVIVPDLRGHGASTSVRGVSEPIDRERMTKLQIETVANDIEACKKFLRDKNNKAQLNIELLCVVAAEEMCIVAAKWAVQDWSWPMLIGRKQGQDVKALVFLSPTWSFKGLTANDELRHNLFTGRGGFAFSLMFVAGENDRTALREAKSTYSRLERTRPQIDKDLPAQERLKQESLFYVGRDTALQGTKLLDPRLKLDVERQIAGFIYYQLSAKVDDYRWQERSAQ